ncbi:unnamed protein product [Cylicocyclus nassatus]|uniref:Uncharacterized protein n=1 Tax=Cylicocyclus nassatus TaxID=53992 RepID=A0AA36H7P3_CYLNA|nr:unnamed protein product [Cylicocyclus nassatus]
MFLPLLLLACAAFAREDCWFEGKFWSGIGSEADKEMIRKIGDSIHRKIDDSKTAAVMTLEKHSNGKTSLMVAARPKGTRMARCFVGLMQNNEVQSFSARSSKQCISWLFHCKNKNIPQGYIREFVSFLWH